MKRSILCILAATLAMFASASPVTLSQARMVAGAWADKNASFGFAGEPVSGGVRSHKDSNGVKLWYEVRMTDGSCLVVSPVTELDPVIAALEDVPAEGLAGLPEDHPVPAMLAVDMTDRLKKLGLYSAGSGTALMGASAPAAERSPLMEKWARQGEARWARYGVGSGARLMASEKDKLDEIATEISVLPGFEKKGALTHWNQGNADLAGGLCYNLYTPEHSVCGCVATAMAAMLQYFGVKGGPKGTNGVTAATFNGSALYNGKPFLTIGGDYDWSLFADKKTIDDYNHLTSEQRELLGRVAYDCGVAVGMMWTPGSSGAFEDNVAKAFKNVFKFKDARAVSANSEQYEKLIYNQCRAGAPVGLGITKEGASSGHSVLAVGYGIDDDGNSRVRIFTGWGGSGDGWYSLPYIDTNGTYDGDSVSYDIIHTVVTMIGYETDETVPVVGQMIPSSEGLVVTMSGVFDRVPTYDEEGNPVVDDDGNPVTESVPRTLKTSGDGYFATRVSAGAMAGKDITLKYVDAAGTEYESAAVTVGDDIVTASKAAALCEALPDEVIFLLLKNTKYALSFKKAIDLAAAEGKAILRVSTGGSVSNIVTALASNLVDRILALDQANGDGAGFADRFVYQPVNARTSKERDGQLTFGVFLPRDASYDERWAWYNGRLSYGYGFSTVGGMTVTDDEGVDVPYDGFDEAISNNFSAVTNEGFTASYLVKGASVSTNDVAFTYDEDGLTNAFQVVLDRGWEEYVRETADIVLTVAGSPTEAGVADPAFGSYTNKFAAGEEIRVESPGLQTNESAGVVMDYRSGVLEVSNTVSAAAATVKIAGATNLTFAAGDVATLTWLGVTNAVWISVTDKDDGGTTYRDGSVAPASGWYGYGETVVLVAVPTNDWAFGHWTYGYNHAADLLADYVGQYAVAQPALSFVAEKPMGIMAGYVERTDDEKAEALAEALATNHVLVTKARNAYTGALISDANLPALELTTLHDMATSTVGAFSTTSVSPVPMLVRPASETFTDAAGNTWGCVAWGLWDENGHLVGRGSGSAAGATFGCATNDFCLYWARVVDEPEEPEEREDAQVPMAADGVSSPLTIYANADGTLTVEAAVGNAVKGWWYVLKTASDVAGPYEKAAESADGDVCVALAESNGTLLLRTTFTPTDEKRFYKVVVEGEEP
ncbi:MAG: C10 family peptidase [Kiritimatiellae bacterium]|nr:C10 family peptidase [Kiritimatiellia bacterium]